jgi:hypothetical protein
MIKRNHRALAIFLVIALTFACAPLGAPSVPPTVELLPLDTAIAMTAGAAASQTAILQSPTFTPTIVLTATRLPTETPSPTPTFIFVLSTPTVPSATPAPGSSGLEYDCRIISQSPVNGSGFGPAAEFDAFWQVMNMGTATWDGNSADYRYDSGDKIHKTGIYDVNGSIPPGGIIDIVVRMKAPKDAGTYTTKWKIKIGKTEFCTMKLTIIVN